MKSAIFCAALLAALGAGSASAGSNIEGTWRTASGNLEVEIQPCGAAFCGTVVKVLANHSMSDPGKDLGQKPGLGLVLLSNFLPAADGSYEGFIYDREAVQTYRCNLSLDADGQLVVLGYLGYHALGRSQLWTRVGSDGAAAAGPAAPEFAGIERWLNSDPLTLAGLRGKVVLIDFWTLACSNCIATLPHVAKWDARYRAEGLVVVGVHTPETPEEAKPEAIADAVERFGIKYPVAEDTTYKTWKAYQNEYWPAVYLVDRRGRVARHWSGEGSYYDIEMAIRDELARGAESAANDVR
ncbi:MAG TPA: DUF2147 domain-containing protein [Myxococcota bacterium]|nr:DUF2147 domain-containing protein [Myxococcota bacterium]